VNLKSIIKAAAPQVTAINLEKYVPYLEKLMPEYQINSALRMRHFLAQLLHESGGLSAVRENLNYSAARLLQIFPKYFNSAQAAEYANKPEKIANRVYANRLGNGQENSGDGWKYRGGGLIQTTGKSNFAATGKGIGIDLVRLPELIAEPPFAVESACWFWKTNGLNALADKNDIIAVTKRINGGTNGLDDRKKYFNNLKI